MKRLVITGLFSSILIMVMAYFIGYWTTTQPIKAFNPKKYAEVIPLQLPERNKMIIDYIQTSGKALAPDYNSVVCTEYVIKVIDHFIELNKEERKAVRIITDDDLYELLEQDATIMKGVQTALTKNNKGIEIKDPAEVMPGDFVQFWNGFQGSSYGHCGIVSEIIPGESITLYSSHPMTDGFGVQKFLWPSRLFFVRLN